MKTADQLMKKKMDKDIMRIPGMASLFVKMWDLMTKIKFGPSCGFQNVTASYRLGEIRACFL